MSRTDQRAKVEAAVKAAESASDPFDSEAGLARALRLARTARAFDLVPTICAALTERRLARRAEAVAAGVIYDIEESFEDEDEVRPGLYLLHPPHVVGADARRLRIMAMEQRVAVVAVCREPVTRMGLCPIVAIAPGATIRTKVKPPHPDVDDTELANWIESAVDAVGDFAVDSIDAELAPIKQFDQLLDRLDAVPEHAGLHAALTRLAPAAEQDLLEEEAAGGRRRRARKAS